MLENGWTFDITLAATGDVLYQHEFSLPAVSAYAEMLRHSTNYGINIIIVSNEPAEILYAHPAFRWPRAAGITISRAAK